MALGSEEMAINGHVFAAFDGIDRKQEIIDLFSGALFTLTTFSKNKFYKKWMNGSVIVQHIQ